MERFVSSAVPDIWQHDMKNNGDDNDFTDRLAIKSEWLNTACNHAVYALTDVFSQYFIVVSPLLLLNDPDLVVLPAGQVFAQPCLEILVLNNGSKFNASSTCSAPPRQDHAVSWHNVLFSGLEFTKLYKLNFHWICLQGQAVIFLRQEWDSKRINIRIPVY